MPEETPRAHTTNPCATKEEPKVLAQGLHHIALGAKDVPTLALFYETAFGLRRIAEHPAQEGHTRSIWLALEPGVLMIEHTKEPRRAVGGVGAGLFLLAFRVAEPKIFEQHLSSLGVEIESRTQWSSYFRDPEGNRLAVSRYPFSDFPGVK